MGHTQTTRSSSPFSPIQGLALGLDRTRSVVDTLVEQAEGRAHLRPGVGRSLGCGVRRQEFLPNLWSKIFLLAGFFNNPSNPNPRSKGWGVGSGTSFGNLAEGRERSEGAYS